MKARNPKLARDYTTGQWTLAVEVDNPVELDEFAGKELDVEIKLYREKRTLSANAYMWALIGKLAEKLNIPANEIYREAIKEIGLYKDVAIDKAAAATIRHVWEAYGLGWFSEVVDEDPQGQIIRLYYGSSSYNSRQMARLIDGVIADCKEFEIETLPPEQLSAMCERWENEKHNSN